MEVPRVLAAAGFDYIFIDAEHTGIGLETIQYLVAASVQASITPMVRVVELLYSLVARALDVGAQGIIFPAWKSLACWPKPSSGCALLPGAAAGSVSSISPGCPGQFDHPDVVEAVLRLQEACRPRGIVTGIQCDTTAQARVWVERGLRFVGAGNERTLLVERARASVAALRALLPARRLSI